MHHWHRVADELWRFRFLLLLFCAVVTAFALVQLPSLRVSNSLDMWYPEDDPALSSYQQFQDRFGSDEIVVVAITAAIDFASGSGIEQVAELTDELLAVEGVANVTSLSTVPKALQIARDRLISDDGKTTAFLVQMRSGTELEERRHAILADLARVSRSYQPMARFAGYGVIYDSLNQASTEDSAMLLMAAHAVMILLLALFFRRVGPIVVTLLAVAVANVWTMGLYAALGEQINMVTMALPTLVMVISIADCVHMLRSVAAQDVTGNRRTRVTDGIAAVIGPCLLTSMTTAFGFLALYLSDLPVVQNLGLFGAVGMLAAVIASTIIVVASLSSQLAEPLLANSFFDRIAVQMRLFGDRCPRRIVVCYMLLIVASAAGVSRIEVDTFSIGYLSESHQTRQDSDFIESELGQYAPIDYLIQAPDVLDDEVLDALQAWQNSVEDLDAIEWSWSLLDALGAERTIVPSTLPLDSVNRKLARMRLLSPVTADSMILDRITLRVTFSAPMMSARSIMKLLQEIESRAFFPNDVSVLAAGYAHLYPRIVERIVDSQVFGFLLALGIILLAIAAATRSLGKSLLAVPANLIPVLATLGLMGWLNIPLDVATATIATVILGLVVDDTVHILRPALPADNHLPRLIGDSVVRCGGSLLMTSLLLCGGFLVMGLAEIRSLSWFGVLTSFAMATAVITDLVLLPALARLAQQMSALHANGRNMLTESV